MFIVTIFSAAALSCNTHNCDPGYQRVTLTDGTHTCLPDAIADGFSKEQPFGSLFFHEELGILELTKKGWTNFEGETVLTTFSE